jgi:putative transposase
MLLLSSPMVSFPVTVTCGTLGFTTQSYYKWLRRPITPRDWEDAHLTNAIIDAHRDDPTFGYRFIADEVHDAGYQASETRVHRLCREQRLWSTTTKKGRRGSGKTPGPAVHDDLVQRHFRAALPDQVWLTDITEHATATVVIHSDRGSQFRSRNFRAVLKANGLTGSMGRVAAAGDNAAMESFFSLLQKNVLDQRRWKTRAELHYEVVTWIERTYNRRRRQRSLGKLTPVEYELAFSSSEEAA